MKLSKATRPKVMYAEIGQNSSTRFAFVSEDEGKFTELFYPVKCRDFLGDVVFSNYYDKKVDIYYFTFHTKLDQDHTKLSLFTPDENEHKLILDNLPYLWKIEDQNNLSRTEIITIDKNTDILYADSFWQTKIWAISLYTHIIRCLGRKDLPNLFEVDGQYSREKSYRYQIGMQNWKKLTENLLQIAAMTDEPTGYGEEEFSGKIHNSTGIASLFGKQGPIKGNKFSEDFHTAL